MNPALHLVRRVITRAPGLGGETYDSVSAAAFNDKVANGDFALHWGAHGMFYGIPVTVHTHLDKGVDCLANFSRTTLTEAGTLFARLVVLNITAVPETLVHRLTERGRETQTEIAKRLTEADKPLPKGLTVINLSNDGPLPDTLARAQALLYPVRS
jgi:ribose 1,5-bisphosphokinase